MVEADWQKGITSMNREVCRVYKLPFKGGHLKDFLIAVFTCEEDAVEFCKLKNKNLEKGIVTHTYSIDNLDREPLDCNLCWGATPPPTACDYFTFDINELLDSPD